MVDCLTIDCGVQVQGEVVVGSRIGIVGFGFSIMSRDALSLFFQCLFGGRFPPSNVLLQSLRRLSHCCCVHKGVFIMVCCCCKFVVFEMCMYWLWCGCNQWIFQGNQHVLGCVGGNVFFGGECIMRVLRIV